METSHFQREHFKDMGFITTRQNGEKSVKTVE